MNLLRPVPLTREGFRPFGEVIEMAGSAHVTINQGFTERFNDLCAVDVAPEGGETNVSVFLGQPRPAPCEIRLMERHPLGSQAFMPLHDNPFLVIVAPAGEKLESEDVRAFLSDGQQGVNLRRGTWHHFQVSLLQVSDYLVIDRVGPGNNFEERLLSPPLVIENSGNLGSE